MFLFTFIFSQATLISVELTNPPQRVLLLCNGSRFDRDAIAKTHFERAPAPCPGLSTAKKGELEIPNRIQH
jgi:hypothetical protein